MLPKYYNIYCHECLMRGLIFFNNKSISIRNHYDLTPPLPVTVEPSEEIPSYIPSIYVVKEKCAVYRLPTMYRPQALINTVS
jgi:hypothetical protein